MSTHTSIIALHLPEHRILYTGLSRTDADRAAAKGRGEGFFVIRAAKPVTGSRGKLTHYTIIVRLAFPAGEKTRVFGATC